VCALEHCCSQGSSFTGMCGIAFRFFFLKDWNGVPVRLKKISIAVLLGSLQ